MTLVSHRTKYLFAAIAFAGMTAEASADDMAVVNAEQAAADVIVREIGAVDPTSSDPNAEAGVQDFDVLLAIHEWATGILGIEEPEPVYGSLGIRG